MQDRYRCKFDGVRDLFDLLWVLKPVATNHNLHIHDFGIIIVYFLPENYAIHTVTICVNYSFNYIEIEVDNDFY